MDSEISGDSQVITALSDGSWSRADCPPLDLERLERGMRRGHWARLFGGAAAVAAMVVLAVTMGSTILRGSSVFEEQPSVAQATNDGLNRPANSWPQTNFQNVPPGWEQLGNTLVSRRGNQVVSREYTYVARGASVDLGAVNVCVTQTMDSKFCDAPDAQVILDQEIRSVGRVVVASSSEGHTVKKTPPEVSEAWRNFRVAE